MKHLLSGGLLFTGIVCAAFNPNSWAYRREVKTVQAPFNVLPLDTDVHRSSRARLNDLRLLRSGKEIPFVLRTLWAAGEKTTVTSLLTDQSAIPGLGTQAVLDTGGGVSHNRVTIDTDETNFRQKVRIETSDDRRHWGIVRPDGTIFDVSTTDQHASNLSVSYSESTRRYLRLTIEGWTDPKALRSASVSSVRQSPAQRETIAEQKPKATGENGTHFSVLELDLGLERPFDQIWFDVGPGFFSRAVTVSASNDRKSWSVAGFGKVERTSRQEQLVVTFPEQWARYIRAAINNEDNPPLNFNRIRVEALKRELIFPAEIAGPYWLYSGNPKAEPARYDLRSTLPSEVNAPRATFGPIAKNPDYKAPERPVTERSPWLLPGLLVLLVPALGAIAFRMLRQLRTSQ